VGDAGDDASGSETMGGESTMTAESGSASMSAGDGDGDGDGNGDGDGDGDGDPTATTSGDGDGDGGGDGDGDGDGDGQDECVDGGDCTLYTDCCYCLALAPGESPPTDCPISECFVDTCTSLGIEAPECHGGTCVLPENYNCDDSNVQCLQPTPNCGAGLVPSLDEDGICWTGQCVPVEECYALPDCTQCPADSTCVVMETQLGPEVTCDPTPPSCGEDTCACAGSYYCVDPFDTCSESGSGDINCQCITC